MNRGANKKNKLVLLIGTLFFLGAAYLLQKQVPMHKDHRDVDSGAYIESGTMFARDGGYQARPKVVPNYALGYPTLVGIVYKILGQSNKAVVLVQVLLALLAGLLLFSLACRMFGLFAGALCFLLFISNIGYLVFAQFILTEILLSFLLLLFFERFYTFYDNNNFVALAYSGLSLGLSVLVKPAAIYFPVCVFMLILLARYLKQIPLIKSITLFLLMFYLPVVSYMAHNKVVFGKFEICALSKVNMYYWLFPHVMASLNNTNSDIERTSLQKMGREQGEQAVDNLFISTIKKHPVLALKMWLMNVVKTFLGLFTTNLKVLVDPVTGGGCVSFFRTTGSWLSRVHGYITMGTDLSWVHAVGYFEAIYLLLRYLISLFACWCLLAERRYFIFAHIGLYVAYFSAITGHDGCSRFRMMFEFVFVLLTAYGLECIFKQLKKSRKT